MTKKKTVRKCTVERYEDGKKVDEYETKSKNTSDKSSKKGNKSSSKSSSTTTQKENKEDSKKESNTPVKNRTLEKAIKELTDMFKNTNAKATSIKRKTRDIKPYTNLSKQNKNKAIKKAIGNQNNLSLEDIYKRKDIREEIENS